MKIQLKFFASFTAHLPDNAKGNIAEVELPEEITVLGVFERFGVPADQAQIVLINGIFVLEPERASRTFSEGDVLAVWPAVAGG
ncbi:sulfur carrier protein ThiS [Motiliproteus sediminis]|uniref:sulfur carrier protein ThiS n=1 Tax=Motiliproteus sediminis TaxID=1468178 RepID=UPI001AEFD62D|nr:MoaD/ThiS family protein [Motiliproteus sediminis]